MIRSSLIVSPISLTLACLALPAQASCVVVGDSVAVGVGSALKGCGVSARVGLSSTASAARAGAGGKWVIASIGSNDFPRGITPAQRAQSAARVRKALARAYASAGGRLILVLPANGGRATVAAWAAQHGVRTVGFSPGRDGIHPGNYGEVARHVRAMMGS
jgi:hypothetical protein